MSWHLTRLVLGVSFKRLTCFHMFGILCMHCYNNLWLLICGCNFLKCLIALYFILSNNNLYFPPKKFGYFLRLFWAKNTLEIWQPRLSQGSLVWERSQKKTNHGCITNTTCLSRRSKALPGAKNRGGQSAASERFWEGISDGQARKDSKRHRGICKWHCYL